MQKEIFRAIKDINITGINQTATKLCKNSYCTFKAAKFLLLEFFSHRIQLTKQWCLKNIKT